MRYRNLLVFLIALVVSLPLGAATGKSIEEFTAGMDCQSGFVPLCWDAAEGKLYMEVSRFGRDFLYVTAPATGLGSNDIGFDRGGPSEELVRFERVGNRVLLVAQNTSFRALGGSEALRQGVEDQFAKSVLRGWEVQAETGDRVLVDATLFFTRDALSLAARLKRMGQGDYRLDQKDRSVIHLPRTKAFPMNTEVEALLTFEAEQPGRLTGRVAPDGRSISVRIHHSLVELPAEPMRPRRFDPRVGGIPLGFNDYSQPFGGRLDRRYVVRWRLEKADSGARLGAPLKPITYYLDPAMPEPVRSAVREGAMWWNKVFESAGFKNAYQVLDLPEGADPRDLRYSIIQWGHRADRGWSWGDAVTDPRSGEILKAVVFFDSHRQRTDFNLWAGYAARDAGAEGLGIRECFAADFPVPDWIAQLDPNTPAEDFVLARARQLAAHEVGHTLGLAHNFAASTYGRASVMDYPAPLIRLHDGRVDLSDAYRRGTGEYDDFAISFLYTSFSGDAEARQLDGIVRDAISRGIVFLTDADARPISGSDPRAQLWDNYDDPLLGLQTAMEVRSALLAGFSEASIGPGEPLWLMEERLAPVYFHHRFALERVTKMVGGMEYSYAVRGDGQSARETISATDQREALQRLTEALRPGALVLPAAIVAQLPPVPFGYSGTVTDERFASATWPAFDELGAARTLATMIVDGLLERRRAARLVAAGMEEGDPLTFDEAAGELLDATWHKRFPEDRREAALLRVAQRAVLDGLIRLAIDAQATVEVRAVAEWGLEEIADEIREQEDPDALGEAMRRQALRDIERILERSGRPDEPSQPLPPPPGSPIGQRKNEN